MKLSIIIPVFNEAKTIAPLLAAVFGADTGTWEKQVIIVDDGSHDSTAEQLAQLQKQYGFLLLRHTTNKGKSAAIRTARGHATGDAVILQDADLEYDPRDWRAMLLEFERGHAVVYGSRNSMDRGYAAYAWGAALLTKLCNALFGSKLTDMYTCYKLMRTDLLQNAKLTSNNFDFCPEITAILLSQGHAIREVGIRYYPRSFAEGKKIRFWDGVRGARTLVARRLKN